MGKCRDPSSRSRKPLTAARLDELALAYVARFATTKAKLGRYLTRKINEFEWVEDIDVMTSCDAVVAKMERLGFLDDRQYAAMRGGAMTRRGLGTRRVRAQLRFDGVAEDDAGEAIEAAKDARVHAALGYARRRRFGPFAMRANDDPKLRERQVAAFVRAGHSPSLAREILTIAPGDEAALAALDETSVHD